MKKWLTAPYPMPGSEGHVKGIVLSILIGLFIFLFLFVFKPFGLSNGLNSSELYQSLGYGLITSLITLLFLNIIPFTLLKNYPEKKWNYMKELLYLLIMLTVIAIGNYLFTVETFSEMNYTITTFINILLGTFILAFFPATFFIAIDMVRNEKLFKKDSDKLNAEKPILAPIQQLITFTSDYDEDDLIIEKDDFLFAEADANYVSFYFASDDKVSRAMLRTTFKKVESTLGDNYSIIKTHRSFIVNLMKVSHFDGNAQGFTLNFPNTEKQARVSRSFTKNVKTILKS